MKYGVYRKKILWLPGRDSRIQTRINNQQLFSCIDFQIYQNDISVNVNSELKIQLYLLTSSIRSRRGIWWYQAIIVWHGTENKSLSIKSSQKRTWWDYGRGCAEIIDFVRQICTTVICNYTNKAQHLYNYEINQPSFGI